MSAEAEIRTAVAHDGRVRERLEGARLARRSTQFAFLLLIAVILVLGAAGAWSIRQIYTLGNDRYLKQAAPLYGSTQDLLVQMLDEETAVRGYVLTSNLSTLQPYNDAKPRVAAELQAIAAGGSADPEIPKHLAAVRQDIQALQAYFDQEVKLARAGRNGRRAARQHILSGKTQFDHFRTLSLALEGDAGRVVQHAQHEQHDTYVRSVIVLGLVVALGLLVAGGLLLRIPSRLYQLYRSEAQARLAAEEGAEASRALAHVAEAVVLVDDDYVVRYWNPAAANLFAVDADLAVGKPLRAVAPVVLEAVSNLGAAPVTLGGRDVWLDAAESPFEGGRVIVLRDLTPDHELERVRSEFVATAAHELRTPLAAIYGAVRTIRRTDYDLPEAARDEFLVMIESESERLRHLMEQLLATAQLDQSSLHLSTGEVDLVELSQAVLETAALRLPDGIRLDPSFPDGSVVVDADAERLRQAVENLLDNAAKYSPDGGRIELRVEARDGEGLISVSDEGIGIPPDERERIFEKFYRLDPSMTRGVGGSGLGLYIIRELVTQMGGEVRVESELGRGSTFTLSLPLR